MRERLEHRVLTKHVDYLDLKLISDTPCCPHCRSSEYVFLIVKIGAASSRVKPQRSRTCWECDLCYLAFVTPEQSHIITSKGFIRI